MKKWKLLYGLLITFPLTNSLWSVKSEINKGQMQSVSLNGHTNADNSFLINNKFGLLNTDNWIVNQNKLLIDKVTFYSYDTSHADFKLENNTNAKELFYVDNEGKLQLDKNLIFTISDADKEKLKNVKTQMENNKKITYVKDNYNPLSESIYNSSYFSGDFSDWKYLQMGSFKTHSLEGELNANRVEHYKDLNEAWGLYYIIKAFKQNKYIKSVADNLFEKFIDKFSSQDQIPNNLRPILFDLLAKKDNIIYNFISKLHAHYNDKNYSLNFVFNNQNNLIEISCKQFNKNNLLNKYRYEIAQKYNGTSYNYNLEYHFWKPMFIIDFSDRAKTWEDFLKIFTTLKFDNSSCIKFWSKYFDLSISGPQLNVETKEIKDHSSFDQKNFWSVDKDYNGGDFGAFVGCHFDAQIYHDKSKIYIRLRAKIYSLWANKSMLFNLKINSVNVINNMGI